MAQKQASSELGMTGCAGFIVETGLRRESEMAEFLGASVRQGRA